MTQSQAIVLTVSMLPAAVLGYLVARSLQQYLRKHATQRKDRPGSWRKSRERQGAFSVQAWLDARRIASERDERPFFYHGGVALVAYTVAWLAFMAYLKFGLGWFGNPGG